MKWFILFKILNSVFFVDFLFMAIKIASTKIIINKKNIVILNYYALNSALTELFLFHIIKQYENTFGMINRAK